jgi:hypothetical protein
MHPTKCPRPLENEPSMAHIRRMEKYRSSMLEVWVTHQPPRQNASSTNLSAGEEYALITKSYREHP